MELLSLSVTALAEALGVSRKTVSKIAATGSHGWKKVKTVESNRSA